MQNPALEGARNLLLNCARLRAGDNLLILHEDPALGWYDDEAPMLVAEVARDLGARVRVQQTSGPDNRIKDESAIVDKESDCCIFFARIGDQLRFEKAITGRKRVMSYAASLKVLASDYCRIEYAAMADLKNAIDDLLLGASDIAISCPLGTNLLGNAREAALDSAEEVSVLRFPVGVHVPVNASCFSGDVRLARFLTPTGSRVYNPPWIAIDEPVTAEVVGGRIVGYAGQEGDIQRIERHYGHVAQQFSIDPSVIHSWHAGIHPGCRFSGNAADDPDRWSNTVFTNPRFLHFHTCGNYAPGEICWMVLDPTICLDALPLWENGTLCPQRFAQTSRCLQDWPQLKQLFENDKREIGLTTDQGVTFE